jgi:hypothetical protein
MILALIPTSSDIYSDIRQVELQWQQKNIWIFSAIWLEVYPVEESSMPGIPHWKTAPTKIRMRIDHTAEGSWLKRKGACQSAIFCRNSSQTPND